MAPWLYALIAHAIIGGLDIVINHEYLARLPRQPALWMEVRLHSIRELIFATIFIGLAWFEWHGWFAAVLAALFLAEVLISIVDTVLELDVRTLPVPERILHVLLFINLGTIIALLGPDAWHWFLQSSALVPTGHGIWSWVLSAQSALALGWCIRDARTQRRLKRRHQNA